MIAPAARPPITPAATAPPRASAGAGVATAAMARVAAAAKVERVLIIAHLSGCWGSQRETRNPAPAFQIILANRGSSARNEREQWNRYVFAVVSCAASVFGR